MMRIRQAQRRLTGVAFASWAMLLATSPAEAQGRVNEYEVKAAFVYNLAKFVQWPPPADPSDQLVIGVIGSDFVFNALHRLVTGKSVQGREIVVRRLRRDDDLRGCHILFVGAIEGRQFPDIVSRIEGTGVLTVGETHDFLHNGGLARFYVENDHIRVQIDAASAQRVGLKISSQLLSLAK